MVLRAIKIRAGKLAPPFLFLFLCSAPLAVAQSQCLQSLADLPPAPELLGFHLGMTKDEVKALVPQTVFGRADEFGVVKTTINPYFDPRIDKRRFVDVRSVSLDFLDDRLVSLWIGYDNGYRIQSIDEYVKMISQALNLKQGWSSWKSKGQQLRCANFQLIVTTVAGAPSFRLIDTTADELIAARRQAKEDREEAAAGETETKEELPLIIGDKQNKVYYPPDCLPLQQLAEANTTTFQTIADAEKAGFKRAKNCH